MWHELESELLYDWRFTVNQFVLAQTSLRLSTTNYFVFAAEPLLSWSLWVCLLRMGFPLSSVPIAHENSSLCTIYRSSVSPGFAKQVISISFALCYNGSLVIWTVVSLTTANFESFMFCPTSPCPMLQTCPFSWFCAISFCSKWSNLYTRINPWSVIESEREIMGY
jgi:hypothetical protein